MRRVTLGHRKLLLFARAILLVASTRSACAQILDVTWTLGTNYPSSIKAGASGVIDGTLVYTGGTPIPALNPNNDSNRTYGIPLDGSNWTQLATMPDSLTYFNGESVGNALYVTGGRSEFQSQSATYRLTHQSGAWQWNSLSAPLNVPRGYFGMGQADGKLMILGGIQGSGQPPYNINTTMNAPEIFDTNNPQAGWQNIPALPGVTRMAPIVAGVDGKFYVFGGTIFGYMGSDSLRLSDAYMYDPITSTWSTLPSTPYGISGADAVVYQDRYIIMVAGGANTTPQPGYYNNKVEVFDTVTHTYSVLPSVMPYGTGDIRASIAGDKIYAVGGENRIPADNSTTPWYQIGQIHFQTPPPPGNTLFRDGFENGTIGAHPGPATIGSWSVSQLGNSFVHISGAGGPGPGVAASGDKYLSFFRASEPPSSDVIATASFVSPPTTGTIHAEWRTWIPEDVADYGMTIGMNSGAVGNFVRSAMFSTVGGLNRVLYRRASGWDMAGLTFAYNTWQLWEVDWELGSGHLTLTIDGVSEVLTIPDLAGAPLDRFFMSSTNFSQSFYLDDLLVQLLDVPGDFDSDGDVDGADFVAWQTHFPAAGGATLEEGDADGDGDVDGADFVVWQTNFPFSTASATSPVSEQQSLALGLVNAAIIAAYGGWQARRQSAKVIAFSHKSDVRNVRSSSAASLRPLYGMAFSSIGHCFLQFYTRAK